MVKAALDWCITTLGILARRLGASYHVDDVAVLSVAWPAPTLALIAVIKGLGGKFKLIRCRELTLFSVAALLYSLFSSFQPLNAQLPTSSPPPESPVPSIPTDEFLRAAQRDSVQTHLLDGETVTRRVGVYALEGCVVTLTTSVHFASEAMANELNTRFDLGQLSSDLYLMRNADSTVYGIYAYFNVPDPKAPRWTNTMNPADGSTGAQKTLPSRNYVVIPVYSRDAGQRIFRGLSRSIRACGGSSLSSVGRQNRQDHLRERAEAAERRAAEPALVADLLNRCQATMRQMVMAPRFLSGDVIVFLAESNRMAFGDLEATTSYGGRSIYAYMCEYRRYNGGWIPASAPKVREKS